MTQHLRWSVLPESCQVFSESEIVITPKLKRLDIPRVTIEIISQLIPVKFGRFSYMDLKSAKNSLLTVTIWADAQAAASSTSQAWHHPNKRKDSLRHKDYIYDLVTVCEQSTICCLLCVLYT